MKENNLMLIKFCVHVIVLTFLVIITFNSTQLVHPDTKDSYSVECAMSEFNIYTNATRGHYKIFNRCYVKVTIAIIYEATYTCKGGFLGIGQSCFEYSEPKKEVIMEDKIICFNIKTGKRCY